jgi:O-antigen biosynthesis protein WbqP
MRKDTPDIATHLVNDSHSLYTAIGPFLRKFSIDELPQLINIIKGEMIFVGPRPALHNQDDLVELRTRVGVHELVPGVTGWAQVNGRDELSIPEKVKFDEYYLINKSWFLDLKIIFLTILKVLGMKGVSH